jgi:uncharacterized protein (DUF1697 family)
MLARGLAKFDVVNIGAVGTFVVRKNVAESALRAAIAQKLPFRCDIIIVPARAVLELGSKDPFSRYPADAATTRFVNVLAKPVQATSISSLSFPSEANWLLKIIAIHGRFVLGVYRREMKAISYLGKIEKQFGVPATTRNWNTFEKVLKILRQDM